MSKNTSTKRDRVRPPSQDSETLVRFAELLKLRGLAEATQSEYLRFARKLLDRLSAIRPPSPKSSCAHICSA